MSKTSSTPAGMVVITRSFGNGTREWSGLSIVQFKAMVIGVAGTSGAFTESCLPLSKRQAITINFKSWTCEALRLQSATKRKMYAKIYTVLVTWCILPCRDHKFQQIITSRVSAPVISNIIYVATWRNGSAFGFDRPTVPKGCRFESCGGHCRLLVGISVFCVSSAKIRDAYM